MTSSSVSPRRAEPYSTADGWIERSRETPGGVIRWRERPKPGQPGVVEQHYLTNVDRFSEAIPGISVVSSPAFPSPVRAAPAKKKATLPGSRPAAKQTYWWQRLSAPTPTQTAREVPKLRADAKPTMRVRLGLFAREAIAEEVRRSRDLLKADFETGGWLFGVRDGGALLLTATGLGNGERKHRSVVISHADLEEELRRDKLFNSDRRFCGCWHVHPTVGRSAPSQPDRANALFWMERDDIDSLGSAIDVIVTPDPERGWNKPLFHAWRTYRDEFGRAFTEPAILEEAKR